ncbi:uncharacterized protein G2W53_014731 [Senna tora]|uniref:Uncharacterized protein n=1 Tax=Senna tora TaxID=362788 RepID=A0A834WU28_9FABA|nr:uncharacterized protein G2W53_014731 [Senna tora]
MLVPVVFAKPSGFEARIGVFMAREEGGSCLNIIRMRNRGWILETFMNYEAKAMWRSRHGMGGAWIMFEHILDEKSQSDVRNVHELRGKSLVPQNRVDFTLELESSWQGRSVDHVLGYFGREIAVRCKSLVAQVNETRRFALYLRNRVDLRLELELSWHGRSVDHVLTYSLREITDEKSQSDLINVNELRGKRSDIRNVHQLQGKSLVSQLSETHRFALSLQNLVDLRLELESSWHGRRVDHVLTYSGR